MRYIIDKGWLDEFRGKALQCEFCGSKIKYNTNYGDEKNDVNGEFGVLGNVHSNDSVYIVVCKKCFGEVNKFIRTLIIKNCAKKHALK